MTPENHIANHIPEDDLVLFALQLLPEERMQQAMSHLQACDKCRTEITRLQGDLAAYSMTAEPHPPPLTARDRFMRQIGREPRLEEIRAVEQRPAEPRPAESRPAEKPSTVPDQPFSLMGDPRMMSDPKFSLTGESTPSTPANRSSDRMPDRLLDRLSDRLPDRMPDHAPERTQDRMSDRMQERVSDRAQDRMSDRLSERLPDRLEDRAPDRTSSEPVFHARQSRSLNTGAREYEDEDVREDRRRPRRAPWVLAVTGWAVAAGCSFVAGLQLHQRQQLQGAMASQQARLDDMQKQAVHAQQAQEALSTLTSVNAMQVALHAAPPAKPAIAVKGAPPVIAPEALAAYLADKGALVFVATHMEPAPAGKTYELWLLPANGQSPIPAGTFKPDAQGGASVVLPQLPKGVQAKGFGVTVENDGGSTTPTLPIVMS